MTKEITKARILQEMQDKFKLREFEDASFLFAETVVPVYNIEQHLERWRTSYKQESITATGGKTFFIVPETERWSLWRYDVVFMGAGAYTVAGLYTHRNTEPVGNTCYLDLGAAKSASYHIELSQPVILNAGDKLVINIDGYTSTQALRVYIDYLLEEMR